jgi:hypothetical protein
MAAGRWICRHIKWRVWESINRNRKIIWRPEQASIYQYLRLPNTLCLITVLYRWYCLNFGTDITLQLYQQFEHFFLSFRLLNIMTAEACSSIPYYTQHSCFTYTSQLCATVKTLPSKCSLSLHNHRRSPIQYAVPQNPASNSPQIRNFLRGSQYEVRQKTSGSARSDTHERRTELFHFPSD